MTTDPFDIQFFFSEADRFRFAVEEDVWTVDRTSGRLITAASRILKAGYEKADLTLKHGVPAQMLTSCTPLLKTTAELEHALRSNQAVLAGAGRRHGCAISREPVPTKPFLPQACTSIPRSQRPQGTLLADSYAAGLRISVAVADRREAIRALNVLRLHLPTLLLHSAWRRMDSQVTGLASPRYVRWRRSVPSAVVPPYCADWKAFLHVAKREGFGDDPRHCRWAVRITPEGAIETRICDVQNIVEKTLYLAAITRILVRAAAYEQLKAPGLAPGTIEDRLMTAAQGKWPASELAETLLPLLKDKRHRDDASVIKRMTSR